MKKGPKRTLFRGKNEQFGSELVRLVIFWQGLCQKWRVMDFSRSKSALLGHFQDPDQSRVNGSFKNLNWVYSSTQGKNWGTRARAKSAKAGIKGHFVKVLGGAKKCAREKLHVVRLKIGRLMMFTVFISYWAHNTPSI